MLKEGLSLPLFIGKAGTVVLAIGYLEERKLCVLPEGGVIFGGGFGPAQLVQPFAVVGIRGEVGDLAEQCQMQYRPAFHSNKIYLLFINTIHSYHCSSPS